MLRDTQNGYETNTNTLTEPLESLLIKIQSDPKTDQRAPFIHFTPTVTEKEISYGEWVDEFLSRVPIFKYFNRKTHKGFIVPLRLKKHFDNLDYHGKEEAEFIGLEKISWKSVKTGQMVLNGMSEGE